MSPREAWISLYDDEIKKTWEEDRKELRNLSMLYCALQKELDRVKSNVGQEIKGIKADLKRRDFLQKCKNFGGLAQSERFDVLSQNKENVMFLPDIKAGENRDDELFIESPSTIVNPPSPEINTLDQSCLSPTIKSGFFSRPITSSPSLLLYPVISHKIDKTPKKAAYSTPENRNNSTLMESSIIDATPEPAKRKVGKSRKASNNKNNHTLTQMFGEPKKKRKKLIASNMPSMEIDEMIQLINQNSGDETDASSATLDNLDAKVAPPPQPPLDVSLTFIKNYDKVPDRKPAKVPDYAYQEVVRGKERKKLRGWSCKECEDYYKAMDLSPEELEKKMNACSKHRARFQPAEETYAGFWDLTFGPSPKTQPRQDKKKH